MTRFLWWLGKEFREHRVSLVLLAVVLLVGTWVVIEVNAGRESVQYPHGGVAGAPPTEGTIHGAPQRSLANHRFSRSEWELLVAVGLALTVLVTAGGLFAAEARRSTLHLIARTPGAWRTALPAKLVFLALVAGSAMLVQGALLGALAGPYRLVEDGQPVSTWCLLPRDKMMLFVWTVWGLGAWALVASAALPLVGVPAFVGAVAGLGTMLPALIWHSQYRFLFRWWLGDVRWFLLVWVLVALAVVVWAWLRGLRYGRRALRIGLSCLAVALGFAAASTAVIASTAARYRNFDAHVPDLRLSNVVVGPGGRFAYASVHRGDPDAVEPATWPHEDQGTPNHVWRIDLTDGAWTELAGEGGGFEQVDGFSGYGGPSTALLKLRLPFEDFSQRAWIDARTGEVFAKGSSHAPPAGSEERVRASLRLTTRVRDGEGRRAWLFPDRIEREGADPIPVALPDRREIHFPFEINGGWMWHVHGVWVAGTDGGQRHMQRTLDANDGRIREIGPELHGDLDGATVTGVIDPRRVLVLLPRTTEGRAPLSAYRVLDVDTGAVEPLLAGGDPKLAELELLGLPDRETALVVVGSQDDQRIELVDLVRGTQTPLAWDGADLQRVGRIFWILGRPGGNVAVDRHIWLLCYRPDPNGRITFDLPPDEDRLRTAMGDRAGAAPKERWSEANVLYDATTRRLRVVGGWGSGFPWCIEPQGSVLVTEDAHRIVRLGPAPGQREVLFPRR